MRLTLIESAHELARQDSEWQALLARSADPQTTQSPLWLSNWWRVFGERDERRLCALAVHDGSTLVGLLPLCRRRHSYAPGLAFRRLELCASGEREQDEICSDYIGPIVERGREPDVSDALAAALSDGAPGDWDELVMPAMNGETFMPWALAGALGRRGVIARVEVSTLSPYIPLPESWEAYLARLSPSRRRSLQRHLKDFDKWSERRARYHVASTRKDVEHGYRILRELHAERWRADGQAGAFASSAFDRFHESVVPELFDAGCLDLSWVSLDDRPLAAVYSIVANGRVQFYQSGRRADLPAKARAGLALHAHAIRRAIESGKREYDFLPGPSQYKLSLALATRPLVTLRAVRPGIRETARVLGEQMTHQARALRAALAGPPQVLQPSASGERDITRELGLATDLALGFVRRLRSSLATPVRPSSNDGDSHAAW